MFLGYAESTKGYRVFDLECAIYTGEVDGIYSTAPSQHDKVTHVAKEGNEFVKFGKQKQDAEELHM